ncbi:hypothetical protein L210DRAFT_3513709 [Boletus edulis BED1]|uniref:Uncharacterized protein n=1 Tax=Boletus edulis BED1 TaxID=1328754 RepID=A0AAD4B9C3_BOLED|nr:hypothetical protein L210DRAFT_3513709 [Boletus edulis BED1]
MYEKKMLTFHWRIELRHYENIPGNIVDDPGGCSANGETTTSSDELTASRDHADATIESCSDSDAFARIELGADEHVPEDAQCKMEHQSGDTRGHNDAETPANPVEEVAEAASPVI